MPSRKGDGPAPGPQGAADFEELVAARIALVVIEEVAVIALLAFAVTVDEVQPDAPAGEHRDGVDLLHEGGRRAQSGADGDEELDPFRHHAEGSRKHDRIGAVRAERREQVFEARPLGAPAERDMRLEIGDARDLGSGSGRA
jgi:hypothetical protein